VPSFGETIYTDGDFTNWTLVDASQPTFSTTISRLTTGGNPAACLELITHSGTTGLAHGFAMNDDAVWSPTTSGAIDSVQLSIDVRSISGWGFGHQFKVAVEQDGKYYVAPTSASHTGSATTWHTIGLGPYSSDSFGRFVAWNDLDATQHPGFSAGGSPIKFGFEVGNHSSRDYTQRYDNWSLLVNAVPEPSVLAMLASGALVLGCVALARWRRRK